MREIIVDQSSCPTPERLHALFAARLGFPTHYGANLSALADCLGDVSTPTRIVIARRLVGAHDGDWLAAACFVIIRACLENPSLHLSINGHAPIQKKSSTSMPDREP